MTLRLGPRTGIAVIGTGSAFPSDIGAGEVLTNDDVFTSALGPDADAVLAERGWRRDHPEQAWGVARREWIHGTSASTRQAAADVSDLAGHAAETALADAGLKAGDVDIVLAATSTPARVTSSLASTIGKRFDLSAPCIDVRAGGAGGLDAWITATRFVSAECPVALVVAAETPSLFLDPDDLAGAFLYGDGAAALVLRHDPEADAGLVGAVLGHSTAPGRAFTVPGVLPPVEDDIAAGRFQWQSPDEQYRNALAGAWNSLCTDLRDTFSGGVQDVAHFLPYAVTAPQVRAASAALGASDDQTFHTLARDGCVGCAGPLLGLDELRRTGRAQGGDMIALAAVAGGVSMAGLLWRL